MGGSTGRIKLFAKFIQNELKDHVKVDKEPCNMSKSDRYVLYKVGPVLAVNVSNIERPSRIFTQLKIKPKKKNSPYLKGF